MKKKQFILGVCFILLASLTGCRDSSIDQGKEVVQQEEVVSKEEPLYNTAFEKYAKDEVVALIMNKPEEEVIKGLTCLDTYTHLENIEELLRFLYKGIIIKHNKTEPTYTKTSLFLCEKRRFFMGRTEKGGKVF